MIGLSMKKLLLPILLTSHAYASTLFEEYTPKFTNKRTSDTRIGLLEEMDPHTIELKKILSHSEFSAFLSDIGESDYCKVTPQKLAVLKQNITKLAKKLFITNWTQSGNIIYPPDRAMATLLSIKSNLLILERQLPRFPHQAIPMISKRNPINRHASVPVSMAYIRDLQNTAHDILFRLLYKFKLVHRIVLKFSGDLPEQTKTSTLKRKEVKQDIQEVLPAKKRFNMISHDKLPVPNQSILLLSQK